MKKTALILSLSSILLSSAVSADTLLGLYIGADGWNAATKGSFADTGAMQQFKFDDKTQTSFYVALEHPIPLLPNIRLQHNKLEASGVTTLDANFSFADSGFLAGSQVNNQVDLTNTDYVLYYEILDNDLVSLDFGVNGKYIKGSVGVSQTAGNLAGVQNVSQIIPMLYTSANVGLPLTGLDLFAQGSFVSYSGSRLYDVQAGIGYALLDNLAVNMRLKAGYRAVNLRLDDIDDLYADLDFTGIFVGVEFHF